MQGNPIQTNFTAGEVSPLLLGRVDITKYANGAQKLENFIVKPQGGITRRSGTRYVAAVNNQAYFTRLHKFIFSTVQAYMLEFGQNSLRIIANGALVLSGGVPIVLNTPYLATDLPFLKFAQSADELYVAHPNYPPMVLSRQSATSWSFAAIQFTDGLEKISTDGPYLDVDPRNYTMSITGVSAIIEIISTNADFSSGSVGKYIVYSNNVYIITSYTDSKHVNASLYQPFSAALGNGSPTSTFYNTSIVMGSYPNQVTYNSYLKLNSSSWSVAYPQVVQNSVISVSISGSVRYFSVASANWVPDTTLYIGINQEITSSIQSTTGTLSSSVASASIANNILITSTANDFTTSSVGQYIQYNFQGNIVIGLINAYISATQVQVTPYSNIIDSDALDPNAVITWQSTNITANGIAYTSRLLASLAVWTDACQYAFINVNGTWYQMGYHYNGTVSLNNVSQDVIGVIQTCTMATVTGNLSYSNHTIVANLTCSNAVFNSSTDVGRCFRLNLNSLQVWGTITQVNSTTTCLVSLGIMVPNDPNIPTQLEGNAQTSLWQLGAWYVGNYPSVVSFHEERLVWGATSLEPQKLWMSNTGDYFNHAPTDQNSNVLASNAINLEIASNIVNAILWLQDTIGVLIVGTLGGEWEITSSSFGTPLSPSNVVASEQSVHGSLASCDQYKIGSRILFVQRSGNKLKELSYFFQTNSFIANDMTILSEHIMKNHGGAAYTTYQQEPNNTLWVLCNDGTLSGFTYDYEQQVQAWHHHTIGASAAGAAVVESIDCIPSIDGTFDQLYLIVRRTINGSTTRYIEYLDKDFNDIIPLTKSSMFFVDCGATVTLGSAGNTATGLAPHLVGETVQVCADGSMRTAVVVPSNGNIVFDGPPATVVSVGLQYITQMLPLPIEQPTQAGTAQGKMKRVQKMSFRFYNSLGFKYGMTLSTLRIVSFQDSGSATIGQSAPLFTGDKKYEIEEDYQLVGTYAIQQDQPYPLTILATMPQMQTFV